MTGPKTRIVFSACMKMDTHIVVARYKEPLDWIGLLSPAQKKCVWIWNKGGGGEEEEALLAARLGVPAAQVRSLPNVGRESHTYLSHVIAEYERLPSRIIFIQGNPFDHIRPPIVQDAAGLQAWLDAWCADIDENGITVTNLVNTPGHELTAPGWRIREWAGALEPAPAALGPWMRGYVGCGAQFPTEATSQPRFLWYMGACFGVSGKCAAHRPRAYYERLRDQVSTSNPEAGHFMERSWFYIFSGIGF